MQDRQPTVRLRRRQLLIGVAGSIVTPFASAQADYPSRPVRIVVPFSPGGPADVVARAISVPLGKRLGQSVIIENRAGGAANIGAEVVARSAPDGYTLLLGTSAHATNASLMGKQLRYDLLKDFTPVGMMAAFPLVLVTHRGTGINSVADLIRRAKANPGQLAYASGGVGGGAHLAAELFCHQVGVKLTHVPYKGTAPAVTDVAAGHVDFMFGSVPSVLGQIQAGRLLALAVTSPARSSALPGVRTVAESGVDAFQLESWFGLLAPAGTPAPVIARLNSELANILSTPDFVASLVVEGGRSIAATPQDMGVFVKNEVAKWASLAGSADIKLE